MTDVPHRTGSGDDTHVPIVGRRELEAALQAFGPLLENMTLVGGHVPTLLVTDPGAPRPRPTGDVDVVASVSTMTGYAQLEAQLRELGFTHYVADTPPVICRWLTPGSPSERVIVDVIPPSGVPFGFTNRWYGHAIASAHAMAISPRLTARVIAPPVFLATKWEAFNDRGQRDWYQSHDFEDIVAVIAGRRTLVTEVETAASDVREFVAGECRKLCDRPDAEDIISGAVPDRYAIGESVQRVLLAFRSLANLVIP
jgi:hypothetical protein